jgi:hypothetical protein
MYGYFTMLVIDLNKFLKKKKKTKKQVIVIYTL